MKNVLYIFLLFFISSVTSFADGRYVHVNRENYNLSCDLVRSIHRDSRGYIWIGTEMGLNRFDGVRMKQYKSDQYKLPSQYIFSISEDGKGMSQFIKGRPLYNRTRNSVRNICADCKDIDKQYSGSQQAAMD